MATIKITRLGTATIDEIEIKDFLEAIRRTGRAGSSLVINGIQYNANTAEFGGGNPYTYVPENAGNKANNLDNPNDAEYPTTNAVANALNGKEDQANKDTDGSLSANSDTNYPSQRAVKTYVDASVTGLLDDRGNYDPTATGQFPDTGGSGAGGAILKGDFWYVSADGNINGNPVVVGSSFRALTDNPGNDNANWNILNAGLGYVPENSTNKDTDDTLSGNSDTRYPSQRAVKSYVDSKVSPIESGGGDQSAQQRNEAQPNSASGTYSMATGLGTEASGVAAFTANMRTKATSFSAAAFGYESEATNIGCFASGRKAKASFYEEKAHGHSFSIGANPIVPGVFQHRRTQIGKSVNGTGSTLLTQADSNTIGLPIPTDCIWNCNIRVNAIRYGGNGTIGDSATWEFNNVPLKNMAGTVSFMAGYSSGPESPAYSDGGAPGAWRVQLVANNTDKRLDIKCTPNDAATEAIIFIAEVEIVQTGFRNFSQV